MDDAEHGASIMARWWRVTIGTHVVVVFCRTTRLVSEPIPKEDTGPVVELDLVAQMDTRAARFSCSNWARRQRHGPGPAMA